MQWQYQKQYYKNQRNEIDFEFLAMTNKMRIIPAIDIIDGKCVRLSKGDYNTKIIYNENPLEVAKSFEGTWNRIFAFSRFGWSKIQ